MGAIQVTAVLERVEVQRYESAKVLGIKRESKCKS
jgi:hypothetical protein